MTDILERLYARYGNYTDRSAQLPGIVDYVHPTSQGSADSRALVKGASDEAKRTGIPQRVRLGEDVIGIPAGGLPDNRIDTVAGILSDGGDRDIHLQRQKFMAANPNWSPDTRVPGSRIASQAMSEAAPAVADSAAPAPALADRVTTMEGAPTKSDRYVVVHQSQAQQAIAALDTHVSKIYKPIGFEVHNFTANGVQLSAIRSADPNFYFGAGEFGTLKSAAVKAQVHSLNEGGFFSSSMAKIEQHARELLPNGANGAKPLAAPASPSPAPATQASGAPAEVPPPVTPAPASQPHAAEAPAPHSGSAVRTAAISGGAMAAGLPAVMSGALAARKGKDASAVAVATAQGLAEGLLPGSTTGFDGITNPNESGWDRAFNAASTATGATFTAGAVSTATGVGAPVGFPAMVAGGVGNVATNLARDVTYLAGVTKHGGLVTGLVQWAGEMYDPAKADANPADAPRHGLSTQAPPDANKLRQK